jgi:hypothetical protein
MKAMPTTSNEVVEVAALRQLLPAELAPQGVARLAVSKPCRRLTLHSATEFSQRENCHPNL